MATNRRNHKTKRNSRNAGMKPGQTNAGSFKPGDARQWKGGQRNKAAVGMTKSFRDVLVMIGGEKLAASLNGKTITLDKIVWLGQMLWKLALDGNIAAIKELLDRIEGKVPQAITGAGGGPIDHNVNVKLTVVETRG